MRSPLSSQSNECANCAIAFSWQGVETPKGTFCCVGCVHGGPCICTYTGVPDPAGVPGSREHALTLVAQPLRSDIAVAEFGGVLERVPGVVAAALVGASGDRAVFRVEASSIPDVLLNVRRIPGFAATITKIEGDCVDLQFTSPSAGPQTAPPSLPAYPEGGAGAPAAADAPANAQHVLQQVLSSLDRVALALAKPPGERSSVGNLVHLSEELKSARSLLSQSGSATTQPVKDDAALAADVAPIAPPPPAMQAPSIAAPLFAKDAPLAPAAAPMARAAAQPVAPEEWPGAGSGRLMSDRFVLIAYPFHNFHSLNAFQRAVRGLDGVRDAKVARFFKGTLHLQVEYQGVLSFADRLREITIRHRILQVGDESVEIEIEEAAGAVR